MQSISIVSDNEFIPVCAVQLNRAFENAIANPSASLKYGTLMKQHITSLFLRQLPKDEEQAMTDSYVALVDQLVRTYSLLDRDKQLSFITLLSAMIGHLRLIPALNLNQKHLFQSLDTILGDYSAKYYRIQSSGKVCPSCSRPIRPL